MKNRITAAMLAMFLGMFGVHKFYLRDQGTGIFYIILGMIGINVFKTPISMFLGWIDALSLFTMSDEKFDAKYNKDYDQRSSNRGSRNARRDSRYESRNNRRYPSRDSSNRSERRSDDGYSPRREQYKSSNSRPTSRPSSRNSPRPADRKPRRPRENPFKKTGISKYKDFDLKGAIEDFEKGIELDPADMALHFNLACAYSLTEQPEKSFAHIAKAVENGFKDFEKIKTHDDLAFLRIQEGFEEFQENGYKMSSTRNVPAAETTVSPSEEKIELPNEVLEDDVLLSQLNKLSELRNKGLLSDKEYVLEKEKLMRR